MSVSLNNQRLLPWPVVFLPGFLCNEDAWQFHQDAMGDLVDSYTWVPRCDGSFTLMAQSFLQQAPDQFILVGISMGGMLAQEIMRMAPDRVCALALLSTAPQTPRHHESFIAILKKSREQGIPSVVHEALKPYYLDKPRPPAMRRHFSLVYRVLLDMAVSLGLPAMVNQVSALTRSPQEWYDTLKMVRVPTMVMFGTHDLICGARGHHAIISALTHKTQNQNLLLSRHTKSPDLVSCWVRMLYGVGHMSALEQPSLTEYHLRLWLKHVANLYGLRR